MRCIQPLPMFLSWFKFRPFKAGSRKVLRARQKYAVDDELNQAVTQYHAGHLDAAAVLYRQVLQREPKQFDASHMLGVIAMQCGEMAKAEALIRSALRLQPANVDALVSLSKVLRQTGHAFDSIEPLQRALSIAPPSPVISSLLAEALLDAGDLPGARGAFVQTTQLAPQSAAAHNNLGAFLRDHGERDAAIVSLRHATELEPGLRQAQENLAAAYFETGHIEESVRVYEQVVALPDSDAAAHHAYGNALMAAGSAVDAIGQYQRALQLDPERANARWALAMAQLRPVCDDVRQVEDSRLSFARAISELDAWFTAERLTLGSNAVGSTQPFYIAYHAQNNMALLEPYGRLCGRLTRSVHSSLAQVAQSRSKPRKLRIGFVSAQVHDHSVWSAITKGWIQHLDPSRFELHLFHLGQHGDDETAWARLTVHQYIDAPRTLTAWTNVITDAQLDALIYPEIGMHTVTTQLALQRLAPVQAASWGHPHTTSFPTLDLFLSAELFEPPDGQAHYTEKLVRLPNLGVCVGALSPTPQVPNLEALGLPPNEPLLLCPGMPFKYSPVDDDVWVGLGAHLQTQGTGRLVFFRGPRVGMSQQLEQRLRRAFGRAGVDFDRTVTFIPSLTRELFYGLMHCATVMLDTIGFSGFNTAIQSLECGLPVIAFDGEFMRGRLASGLLRRMDLDEWIAATHSAFIDLAMRLITDKQLGLALRRQIEQRRTILFNDLTPVRALEQVLLDAVADQSKGDQR